MRSLHSHVGAYTLQHHKIVRWSQREGVRTSTASYQRGSRCASLGVSCPLCPLPTVATAHCPDKRPLSDSLKGCSKSAEQLKHGQSSRSLFNIPTWTGKKMAVTYDHDLMGRDVRAKRGPSTASWVHTLSNYIKWSVGHNPSMSGHAQPPARGGRGVAA